MRPLSAVMISRYQNESLLLLLQKLEEKVVEK